MYVYLQQEQYSGMKVIFQKTLYLLQLLIRENDTVQFRIFNNLDTLLDVQVVPSDLALALKEVYKKWLLNHTMQLRERSCI